MSRTHIPTLLVTNFVIAALRLLSVAPVDAALAASITPSVAVDGGTAAFVGRQACGGCHAEQVRLWQGSHHDRAMQIADDATVLGNFNKAPFTAFGVTSTFFKRDGKFFVRTDGPDGKLHEYPIAYTFGVEPLQQYLIAFPGGRYQALSIAWDSRPKAEGGQRWFHLYPTERIASDDILHWTGLYQNWNSQCADCHSTNVEKSYRSDGDQYHTTWSEIDVSCEACHGPGAQHVAWATSQPRAAAKEGGNGLVVQLGAHDGGVWVFDTNTGIAHRNPPRKSEAEMQACARCHARRGTVDDHFVFGQPLMDMYRPSLLEEPLYYADGQIKDEVYEYGSFLQSKMYAAGVTCSDCHEPHSLELRAPANGVCARCHLPQKFDVPAHHHHPSGSAGARCVECHMPSKRYMVIDPRRDHSIRVPRPDLSSKLGTPDACTGCHSGRSAAWAAEKLLVWYGPRRAAEPHYGEAIAAGRDDRPGAEGALTALASTPTTSSIVRASAVSLLRSYLSPESLPALATALRDADPLVRSAAVNALAEMEPRTRLQLLFPLLSDPVRVVRIDAAQALASVPADLMTPAQVTSLNAGLDEFEHAQLTNAERPEPHLNLGVVATRRGQLAKAEAEYSIALRLAPPYGPTYVNLADLYRLQGRDDDGERILRKGIAMAPNNGDLFYALGLLLVRQKRLPEAVDALGRAAQLSPQPHYSYVFGVALQSSGQIDRAIDVLGRAHQQHPGDREILIALSTFNRDRGALPAAIEYARKLVALSPQDAQARQLLDQLQATQH